MDSQLKSSGLALGWRPLGAVLHSSNEPGELSQWLCHDDSTINIVLDIIIIIIYGLIKTPIHNGICCRNGFGNAYSNVRWPALNARYVLVAEVGPSVLQESVVRPVIVSKNARGSAQSNSRRSSLRRQLPQETIPHRQYPLEITPCPDSGS